MVNLDRIILVGNGNSVADGLQGGLVYHLKKEIVFCINQINFLFNPCAVCFSDADRYGELRSYYGEKFILIGRNLQPLKGDKNTFSIDTPNALGGIVALRVALKLGFKEIYLLGYDWGKVGGKLRYNGDTSKTPLYDGDAEKFFKEFEGQNIFNVSVHSKIPNFPKLTYEEFFSRLINEPDRIKTIAEIKRRLKNVQ